MHSGCASRRFPYGAAAFDSNKENDEKVRETREKHVTDTARRAHKGPGGIMHGGCSVNFGTQNSVSGLLRCRPSPTSARTDKSVCIYIKESRLRREKEKEPGGGEKG